MLIFFDLIYNKFDEIPITAESNDFLKTLGATLFGFMLSEGYSLYKEHNRIKKAGKEFYWELELVIEDLHKQIESLNEDITFINPEDIVFTGRPIRVIQGLNTKSLLNTSKSDLARYIRFKIKGEKERNSFIKEIHSTLSLINHEFERIQLCINNAILKSGLQTDEYSSSISSLMRAFSDILSDFEKTGNDINNDPGMLELFNVIKTFQKDTNPNKGHTEIYLNVLIPISKTLANYRLNSHLIGMREPLRKSFDSFSAIKKTYKEFKEDLIMAQTRFSKYLASLEIAINKTKK